MSNSQQFDDPSFEQLRGADNSNSSQRNISQAPQREVERILQKHEMQLREIDGVVGVGIKQNAIGESVMVAYISHDSVKARVPKVLDGLPVETVVSGEFFAQ